MCLSKKKLRTMISLFEGRDHEVAPTEELKSCENSYNS